MDDARFDRLARTLISIKPGRRALLGLTGAGLAGLLGLAAVAETAAACVPLGQKRCRGRRNRKCCPGATCRGGHKRRPGTCVCKSGLSKCDDQCLNLATDAANCGACGNVCPTGFPCTNGVCAGTGPQGCPAGFEYCTETQFPPACPSAPNCYCTTDVENTTRCARLFTPDAFCRECASNAECGAGFLCIKAAGNCYQCGTLGGTACIPDCG